MLSLTDAMIAYLSVRPIVTGLRMGFDEKHVYFFIETPSGELISPPERLADEIAGNRPRLLRSDRVRQAIDAARSGQVMEFYQSL